MLNQLILVGRITKDPEAINTVNGKKLSSVTLAVPRPYKNDEGIYETDFIRCILWNEVASATSEYCRKGDMIGVKGRIQTNSYEDENGKTIYVTDVIAEKVTFLNSNNRKDKDELDEE